MTNKNLRMAKIDCRLIIDDTVYIAVHNGELITQHIIEYYGPANAREKFMDFDLNLFKERNFSASVYLEKCLEVLLPIFKDEFYKEVLNDD